MMRIVLAMIGLVFTSVSAVADTPGQDAQAREIFARVVGFRTAAGHDQTPAMVAYLADLLTKGGVPASDIVTLDQGGARATIVRVPGRERGRPPSPRTPAAACSSMRRRPSAERSPAISGGSSAASGPPTATSTTPSREVRSGGRKRP